MVKSLCLPRVLGTMLCLRELVRNKPGMVSALRQPVPLLHQVLNSTKCSLLALFSNNLGCLWRLGERWVAIQKGHIVA